MINEIAQPAVVLNTETIFVFGYREEYNLILRTNSFILSILVFKVKVILECIHI